MESAKQRQMAKSSATRGKVLVWKKNSSGNGLCSYSDIDSDILRRTVALVTAGGGAIMFGVTSDGGAFSVVVLHDQQKLKEYPHTPEELSDLLEQLSEQFGELFTG